MNYQSNVPEHALKDVYDGRIYKSLLNSEDGQGFKRKEAFSLLINADGISSFEKPRLTIWPVYLVVNEIPIQERFRVENLALAGLSVGEEKPNINTFYASIVKKNTCS